MSADENDRLADVLAQIASAEAMARFHDRMASDRESHADAAQRADEAAEAGRRKACALIEEAFPGVSWQMIAAVMG